jgi:tape measure domain-containing protein
MTVAELTAKISVIGEAGARQAFVRLGQSARTAGESIRTMADSMRLLELAGNVLSRVSGVQVAMSFDSQVRALAGYQKNAKDLEAQLARLQEIAKLPGLGLSEVRMGVLSLEAAGLSARLAERSISAFGNAIAQAGRGKEDLAGAVLALGQIASKGKISAEEINQLAERIPQIRKALQGAFGTADTEKIQKMGVSATVAIGKIIAELEKIPKATNGARVTLDNMQDAFDRMTLPIGRGILDIFMGASSTGEQLIVTLERITTAIGEVLSAVGKSGVIADMFAQMNGGVVSFGRSWQEGLATGLANVMSFVSHVPMLWNGMIKDIGGAWSVFWQNFMIDVRNSLRDMISELADTAQTIAGLFGVKTPGINKIMAREAKVSYAQKGGLGDAITDMAMTAANYRSRIIANLGKQGLPEGLIFGGGAKTMGAAAADADKKEKDRHKTLQRIEANTRRSADALDLRTQTIGGGKLGALGVTGTELAAMGMRASNDMTRAKPISADSMVNRGIKQMIQNNLGFAVNGGRSLPIR